MIYKLLQLNDSKYKKAYSHLELSFIEVYYHLDDVLLLDALNN